MTFVKPTEDDITEAAMVLAKVERRHNERRKAERYKLWAQVGTLCGIAAFVGACAMGAAATIGLGIDSPARKIVAIEARVVPLEQGQKEMTKLLRFLVTRECLKTDAQTSRDVEMAGVDCGQVLRTVSPMGSMSATPSRP